MDWIRWDWFWLDWMKLDSGCGYLILNNSVTDNGYGFEFWISQDLNHSGFRFQHIAGVTYTLVKFDWIPWVT
jgi:hypothetical protein